MLAKLVSKYSLNDVEFEKAYLGFLSRVTVKQPQLVKKVLLEMPKRALLNFTNPLVLSDFLTHFLDQESDVEL